MPKLSDIKKVVKQADPEILFSTCFVGYKRGLETCRVNSPNRDVILSILETEHKKGVDKWKVIYPYEPQVVPSKDLAKERVRRIIDNLSVEEKQALNEIMLKELYQQPVVSLELLKENHI